MTKDEELLRLTQAALTGLLSQETSQGTYCTGVTAEKAVAYAVATHRAFEKALQQELATKVPL